MEQTDEGFHAQAPLSGAARRRILVVDDDRLTADSLAKLLQLSRYDVHTRYDGAAAVAAAEAVRPHLILLDLGMPVLNGYEACQKIRSKPWGEGVVIVAVTGWGPESEMPAVEDCGFNAHVVKPVKPGELVQLLTNLLQEGPKS